MLLDSVYRDGVQSAIDWFMIGHAQNTRGIYKCSPLLVKTTAVMHETSDTNQAYPEQLVHEQVVNAMNKKRSSQCSHSLVRFKKDFFDSKFSIELNTPANGSLIESSRPILVQPSIVLEDGYESSHFYDDWGCASISAVIGTNRNDLLPSHNATKVCTNVHEAGTLILDGVPTGDRTLQIWVEQDGVTIGKRSKLYTVSAIPPLSVRVTEPSHNLSYVLPSFTMKFSYVVIDENNMNPTLWRMCMHLSSPWYAQTRSLGCQPIQPDITFSNLPY